MADHLLVEHGDKMALAHAVEGRYQFLDLEVVQFVAQMDPSFKLRGFDEKYILKQIARSFVPEQISSREKFGWFAPGSAALLRDCPKWVDENLVS